MTTAPLTMDPATYRAGDRAATVIVLDTPLMRSMDRHPAGRDRSSAVPRQRPRSGARVRSSRPAYTLTRRGRVVVFLVALLASGAAVLGVASQVTATDQPGQPVPATTVTIGQGETLWDVAAKANPRGDIRETVHDIAKLNAISRPGEIPAGTTIYVPVY